MNDPVYKLIELNGTSTNASEDEEGRSDQERLTDEGIAGAGHDQTLEAAKAARKKVP